MPRGEEHRGQAPKDRDGTVFRAVKITMIFFILMYSLKCNFKSAHEQNRDSYKS